MQELLVRPEPKYQVASSGPGSAGPIAHYAQALTVRLGVWPYYY